MKDGGDNAISVFHSKVTILSTAIQGTIGVIWSNLTDKWGDRLREVKPLVHSYNREVSLQHIPFLIIILMTKPDSLTRYVIKDRVNNLR